VRGLRAYREGVRKLLALQVVAALALTGSAAASWSPAHTFSARHGGPGVVAVNGRGDVAVLWQSRKPARLRVTLLRAREKALTRVVGQRPGSYGAIALDERGSATVAWTEGARLYAAYGSLTGRWSAPRLIARNAFGPVLAVSRQRRVLLAWTNLSKYGPGSTGVAWRTPGRKFSKPMTMVRPAPTLMPGEAPQSDLHATFDRSGRAYLWGTCDGVVRVAAPSSRRLGLVSVAPGRALGFSFAIAADGHGLASWVDSRCTQDAAAGPEPGPLNVRAFATGSFGPPQTFRTASSSEAFAIAGGGSIVGGWSFADRYELTFDAQGALLSDAIVPGDRLPIATDAGGDLLTSLGAGFAAQPIGGAEQPLGHAGAASAAANGRRFAVAWDPDVTTGPDQRARSPRVRLSVSVWQP
jgi:hypothetical protein